VSEKEPDHAALTKQEMELVQRIATRDGMTLDEAATKLARQALERRVRKRTKYGPARVYSIKK
jgi:hypothetical protein